jgi:hypothetical protein
MEDDILLDFIVELNCGHDLCTSCLEKLVLNQCPYCRTEINENRLSLNKEEDYYFIIDISFDHVENLYPRRRRNNKKKKNNFKSNRDRSEYERKSKKWKKENNRE